MTNEPDRIFRSFLSELYRDVLKPRGWKREGFNFRMIRQEGIVTRGMIINFQKSQWNTAQELRFTVNAGRKLVIGAEIDPKFKEYACHFSDRKRPQNLCPRYDRDQWWSITEETDCAELKAELTDYLIGYAVPWLTGEPAK